MCTNGTFSHDTMHLSSTPLSPEFVSLVATSQLSEHPRYRKGNYLSAPITSDIFLASSADESSPLTAVKILDQCCTLLKASIEVLSLQTARFFLLPCG